MPLEKLCELAEPFWQPAAKEADKEYKKKVLSLVQERLKYLAELPHLTDFFFADLPVNLELIDNNKQLSKFSHAQLKELLEKSQAALEQSDFSVEDLTDRLNQLLEELDQKPGVLFGLIRIATTWTPASPGLADTLSLLGKDKSLSRLKLATNELEK
jgi:glutamyl/glutaminyl-tRNA synthetase